MLFGLTLRCLRRRAVSPTLRRLSDFPATGRSRGFRASFGNGLGLNLSLRLILRSALLPTLFGLLSSQGLTRLASTKRTRTRRLFCRRPSPNEANSARKRTRASTRLPLRGSNVSGIRVCAWGGYQDSADQEVKLKPGRGCTRHRTQRLIGQISGARERLSPPVLCLDAHAFKLIVWGTNQNITGAVTRNSDDQQVAQTLEEILNKTTRIMPRGHHFFNDAIRCASITTGKSINALIQKRGIRVAKQCNCGLIRDFALDSAGHELIQHG